MAVNYTDLVQQATHRATSDPEYAARLERDPKTALQELTDELLPESLVVNHGVVPREADGSISIEELEAVSGGMVSENGACLNIYKCSAVGI